MPLPVRPTIPSAVRIWNRPCGSWPDCGRPARPMTSRGADYAELLQTRVRRNMAILREEAPQRAVELRQLQTSGLLDAVIADLDDGQADMAADLALIRMPCTPARTSMRPG